MHHQSPLSTRVTAPLHLDLPAPVAGLVFRPLGFDDVDAVHALVIAAAEVDSPEWRPSTAEVRNDLSTSAGEPALDGVVGVDAGGHVLAYGFDHVVEGRETLLRIILQGAVHPTIRGAGVGRAVLGWQLDRGRQILAAIDLPLPGMLETTALEHTAPTRLAHRAGMQDIRWWFELERRVDPVDGVGAVDVPALPAGLSFAPYSADVAERCRLARNDSFRDHWGSQPTSADGWAAQRGTPSFRADLSRVVLDDASGDVVAFCLVDVDPDLWPIRGTRDAYIDYVGVVRAHRGRGLAPAVMAASMRAAADDGLETVSLDVDARNPSGALGLYERMGFTRRHVAVSAAITY